MFKASVCFPWHNSAMEKAKLKKEREDAWEARKREKEDKERKREELKKMVEEEKQKRKEEKERMKIQKEKVSWALLVRSSILPDGLCSALASPGALGYLHSGPVLSFDQGRTGCLCYNSCPSPDSHYRSERSYGRRRRSLQSI